MAIDLVILISLGLVATATIVHKPSVKVGESGIKSDKINKQILEEINEASTISNPTDYSNNISEENDKIVFEENVDSYPNKTQMPPSMIFDTSATLETNEELDTIVEKVPDEIMLTASGFAPLPIRWRQKRRRYPIRRNFVRYPLRRRVYFYYPYYPYYYNSLYY